MSKVRDSMKIVGSLLQKNKCIEEFQNKFASG